MKRGSFEVGQADGVVRDTLERFYHTVSLFFIFHFTFFIPYSMVTSWGKRSDLVVKAW